MSTPSRTLRNLRKIGFKQYMVQLMYIGDTKAGTLIGTDKFGNKFYEDNEELPLRTRWVDYAKHDFDAAHIEPLWHAWMSYGTDTPPNKDHLYTAIATRAWAKPGHTPNYTATRGAYKPYSTTQPKVQAWDWVAAKRT
ncbi:hypothetical protein P8C59_004934 [Phyllachora maydis]|uniref:NADH dehydrogenase [ubiquinone] 1 alpha subcomplex subunit n=1 Tax=Phyllachora maydis TaxID=1825666 RepID=A0AAD9I3B7_9PEZI|nr:hypothetical protein P8C59_004934 [Phyllachora maydis]